MKLNVLFVASSSDWHVDLWVKYFAKKHVCFLFSDNENYLDDQPFDGTKIFFSDGVFGKVLNFLRLKSHRVYQANKLLSSVGYALRIRELIQKHSIDVVHAHSLYYGFVCSFLPKDMVKVIFTPMGSDIILHAQTNPIYRWMAKRAYLRADLVTSDSKLLKQCGLKVGARENANVIIQNGVDQSIFFPRESQVRSRYDVDEDEFLIFSPRAMTPIYNIDVLIESLKILKDSGYSFKCCFAYAFGNSYVDDLKRQIHTYSLDDRVVFLGRLSYEAMAEVYAGADVTISIPSSDSSPKSVYESLFCKTPVILSDLPWSHEFLGERDGILRVKCRDAADTARAIKILMTDRNLKTELGEMGLRIANKYFSYNANMLAMERLMIDLVSKNDRGIDADLY